MYPMVFHVNNIPHRFLAFQTHLMIIFYRKKNAIYLAIKTFIGA